MPGNFTELSEPREPGCWRPVSADPAHGFAHELGDNWVPRSSVEYASPQVRPSFVRSEPPRGGLVLPQQVLAIPAEPAVVRRFVHDGRFRMDLDCAARGAPLDIESCDGALYDSEEDPGELRNMIHEPGGQKVAAKLVDALASSRHA